MMKFLPNLIVLFSLILAFSCESEQAGKEMPAKVIENGYDILQEKLLDAKPGQTITIPAGFYKINRALSLDNISNVTIQGEGKDKTVLSFLDQISGAEGIRITADSITLKDFTVADAKGDAIKLQDCKGVLISGIQTTWTQGAKATNGGYGLYPVQCEDVVIDGCEASYASDAGIYVGQSSNVIVKNSYAHHNVAGIEIENCTNAEVFDNLTENNAGGLLVFDLPDLEVVNGKGCKLYNNKILSNNHKNFAAEGNMVAIIPPGSGIVLLAAKDVEIYNNEILDHKTIGIGITSFQITELPWKDERYDPYTYNISIYNNKIMRKAAMPDITKDFGRMVNMLFPGRPQDILYDGILKEGSQGTNPMNICIKDNEVEEMRFANVDAANNFKNVTKSVETHACL